MAHFRRLVAEALSVILQVLSFKIRKKRIFAMAPIHHHFELKGWHENKVITRFWILSIILAMAGVARRERSGRVREGRARQRISCPWCATCL